MSAEQPLDQAKEKKKADVQTAIDQATRRVRTRAVSMTFTGIIDMYNNGDLEIDPDFQRAFRWSEPEVSIYGIVDFRYSGSTNLLRRER